VDEWPDHVDELAIGRLRQRIGNAVEEGEELEVFSLGHGIELVVMAAGALQREPHEGSADGLDPVGHILDAIRSSGLGGRPVRSSDTRRSHVSRSAAGAARSPSFVSRSSTNRSSGSTGQAASAASAGSAGTGGPATGANDQWGAQGASAATHAFSNSICRFVGGFLNSGGGIIVSGSVDSIRATSSLSATEPGTTARMPEGSSRLAASRSSSRRSACREWASRPWQL